MRAPVGSSACWLCAMLDVLSALTLSATAQNSQGGGFWTLLAGTGGGEQRGAAVAEASYLDRRVEEEEEGRYVRAVHHQAPMAQTSSQQSFALDHGLSGPGRTEKDIRDTEVLQIIDQLTNTHPENCSIDRSIMLNYKFDEQHFQEPFREQAKKAVHLANVLNNLFRLYNHRSDDLYKDVTYFALTNSLVQSDPRVKGCGIAFQKGQYRPGSWKPDSFFYPYSYRLASGATIVSDMARFYEPFNTSWFLNQSRRDPSRLSRPLETVFTNASNVGSYSSKYEFRWNKTVHVSEKDGYWANPSYDCLLEAWILPFSVPFFEMHASGTAIFK